MYSLISQAVTAVFNYCTDFVINLANLTGLSYYEINTFIFIILWPLLTAGLSIVFIVQKIRIIQAKRNKVKQVHYLKVKA